MTANMKLLAAIALLLSSAEGFGVGSQALTTIRQRPMTTSSLASTIYSDFSAAVPSSRQRMPAVGDEALPFSSAESIPLPTTSSTTTALSDLYKPKHGPSSTQMEAAKSLMTLETVIGRGAMILAVILMATELTTGMSLPDQLSKFLS